MVDLRWVVTYVSVQLPQAKQTNERVISWEQYYDTMSDEYNSFGVSLFLEDHSVQLIIENLFHISSLAVETYKKSPDVAKTFREKLKVIPNAVLFFLRLTCARIF